MIPKNKKHAKLNEKDLSVEDKNESIKQDLVEPDKEKGNNTDKPHEKITNRDDRITNNENVITNDEEGFSKT